MTYFSTRGFGTPSVHEELVRERIQTRHRQAEEHRRARDLLRARRARREVERASLSLRHALLRLV
ncbi:hypothetical protein GCM10017673_42680 [Streptosporangium violaceochromogenes]|nr:hypothetical protein GCM10017673_42680 [Streptosporangium violaceochromogenes]